MDSNVRISRRPLFFARQSSLRTMYGAQDGTVLNSAVSVTRTNVNSIKMSFSRSIKNTKIISENNFIPAPVLGKEDVKFMAEEISDICKQLHCPNQVEKGNFLQPPGHKFYSDVFFFLAATLDKSVIDMFAKDSTKSNKNEYRLPLTQIDFMIKFLTLLGFPHKINKSYLISVTSVHSWPFLLFTLYWFAVIVAYYKKLDPVLFFGTFEDSEDGKSSFLEQVKIVKQLFQIHCAKDTVEFNRFARQAYECDRCLGSTGDRMKEQLHCLKLRIAKLKERPQKFAEIAEKFSDALSELHKTFVKKRTVSDKYETVKKQEQRDTRRLEQYKLRLNDISAELVKLDLQRKQQDSRWTTAKIEALLCRQEKLNNQYEDVMFRQERIIRELNNVKEERARIQANIKECIDSYNSDIIHLPNAEIFRNLYLPNFNPSNMLSCRKSLSSMEKVLQDLMDIRNVLQKERAEAQRKQFSLKLKLGDLEKDCCRKIAEMRSLEAEVNKLLKKNDELWLLTEQIKRQIKVKCEETKERIISRRLHLRELSMKNRQLKLECLQKESLLENLRMDHMKRKQAAASYVNEMKARLIHRQKRRNEFASFCMPLIDKFTCILDTNDAKATAAVDRIQALQEKALAQITMDLKDLCETNAVAKRHDN